MLLGAAAVIGAAAQAQPAPASPQNVLTLQASASAEVPMDLLGIVFSTTREGTDAAVVQSQLKQALDAALAEAKKAAKPGQLEVQTGNFSLYPRYAAKGGIAGWQGRAELIVEGRDTAAIAQLAGRVQTLSIARAGFSLSREARHKAEAEVTAQAITRFRNQAQTYAQQFGFTGYTVREVNIGADLPQAMMAAAPRARLQMDSAAAEAPLPTEAGKATVTVNVGGSVQMSR
jgi:predicted secreted protein